MSIVRAVESIGGVEGRGQGVETDAKSEAGQSGTYDRTEVARASTSVARADAGGAGHGSAASEAVREAERRIKARLDAARRAREAENETLRVMGATSKRLTDPGRGSGGGDIEDASRRVAERLAARTGAQPSNSGLTKPVTVIAGEKSSGNTLPTGDMGDAERRVMERLTRARTSATSGAVNAEVVQRADAGNAGEVTTQMALKQTSGLEDVERRVASRLAAARAASSLSTASEVARAVETRPQAVLADATGAGAEASRTEVAQGPVASAVATTSKEVLGPLPTTAASGHAVDDGEKLAGAEGRKEESGGAEQGVSAPAIVASVPLQKGDGRVEASEGGQEEAKVAAAKAMPGMDKADAVKGWQSGLTYVGDTTTQTVGEVAEAAVAEAGRGAKLDDVTIAVHAIAEGKSRERAAEKQGAVRAAEAHVSMLVATPVATPLEIAAVAPGPVADGDTVATTAPTQAEYLASPSKSEADGAVSVLTTATVARAEITSSKPEAVMPQVARSSVERDASRELSVPQATGREEGIAESRVEIAKNAVNAAGARQETVGTATTRGAVIDTQKLAAVEVAQIAQVGPHDGAVLAGGEVELSWKGSGSTEGYRIQVATRDGSWTAPVVDRVVRGTNARVNLRPGQIYRWRVVDSRQEVVGTQIGASRVFDLRQVPSAPVLEQPQFAPKNVLLRWAVKDAGQGMRIIVARDAAFQNVVVDKRTWGSQMQFPRPDGGAYHLRMQSIIGDGMEVGAPLDSRLSVPGLSWLDRF